MRLESLFIDVVAVSLVLGMALFALRFLRGASASQRHMVLAAALAAALLSPLIRAVSPFEWALFELQSSEIPVEASIPLADPDPDRASPTGAVSPMSWLWVAWIGGLSIHLAWLVAGFIRLSMIGRRWEVATSTDVLAVVREVACSYGIRRIPRILMKEGRSLLATWGVWRATIAVPGDLDSWNADHVRIAMAHELAHVRRQDWAFQIVAELMRAVYWFNPLIWVFCRRLRTEADLAADDMALGLHGDPVDFAAGIVELVRELRPKERFFFPVFQMAGSGIERRIEMMLNPRTSRVRPTSRAWVVTALVAASLTAVVSCTRIQATSATLQAGETLVSGSVVDPTGALVPGALIVLENETFSFTKISSASGRYSFEDVPAGEYAATASLPGFEDRRREGIVVRPGQPVEQSFLLGVGTQSTQVSIRVLPFAGEPDANEPASTDGRMRVSAGVFPGRMVEQVQPVYPQSMRRAGIEGTVVLEGVIDTSGRPVGLRVVDAPHVALAFAAIEAVRQWRYEPTLLNGAPVEAQSQFVLDFGIAQ